MARINFESIDNPPILDLNGPLQPGTNFVTSFTEGGTPISVRKSVHTAIFYMYYAIPDMYLQFITCCNFTWPIILNFTWPFFISLLDCLAQR